MRYDIVVAPEAVQDLKQLDGHTRAKVRDRIERHLRFEPEKTSRSRIKRLQGMRRPQYRLRVDDVRVFYDVGQTVVEILAVVRKSQAGQWLETVGESA